MVEPEQEILPLGTPFSSVHSSTHYLQVTNLQYVSSITTIELRIKNGFRNANTRNKNATELYTNLIYSSNELEGYILFLVLYRLTLQAVPAIQ